MQSQANLMTTGAIGLGAIGSGMTLNLHRHNPLYYAWKRSRERVEGWACAEKTPLVKQIIEFVEQAVTLSDEQILLDEGHAEEDIFSLFRLRQPVYE